MNIKKIIQFCQQEKGITSLEYGLIGVAIAAFVVFILYGENSFVDATLAKFVQLGSVVKAALLTTS